MPVNILSLSADENKKMKKMPQEGNNNGGKRIQSLITSISTEAKKMVDLREQEEDFSLKKRDSLARQVNTFLSFVLEEEALKEKIHQEIDQGDHSTSEKYYLALRSISQAVLGHFPLLEEMYKNEIKTQLAYSKLLRDFLRDEMDIDYKKMREEIENEGQDKEITEDTESEENDKGGLLEELSPEEFEQHLEGLTDLQKKTLSFVFEIHHFCDLFGPTDTLNKAKRLGYDITFQKQTNAWRLLFGNMPNALPENFFETHPSFRFLEVDYKNLVTYIHQLKDAFTKQLQTGLKNQVDRWNTKQKRKKGIEAKKVEIRKYSFPNLYKGKFADVLRYLVATRIDQEAAENFLKKVFAHNKYDDSKLYLLRVEQDLADVLKPIS